MAIFVVVPHFQFPKVVMEVALYCRNSVNSASTVRDVRTCCQRNTVLLRQELITVFACRSMPGIQSTEKFALLEIYFSCCAGRVYSIDGIVFARQCASLEPF